MFWKKKKEESIENKKIALALEIIDGKIFSMENKILELTKLVRKRSYGQEEINNSKINKEEQPYKNTLPRLGIDY